MITDIRSKILRVGDTVHKIAAKQTVNKGEVNGRVLDEIKSYRIRGFVGDKVQLRTSPKPKWLVDGNEVIKE